MSLRGGQDSRSGILSLSWNQDDSCVALGTQSGLVIFNLDTHKTCYKLQIGAIGVAEMLYCTSLIGYVGAGEQPALSPRRLTLYNTAACKTIHDMSFSSAVLAVHMNRLRLVVILEHKVFIYCLNSLEHRRCIDTPPNASAISALCSHSDANSSLLALPASDSLGTIRVYNLMVEEGSVLCEIDAHKSPVSCVAWNHDGTLLASASQTGTVIRVHKMPEGKKVFSFRRGTYPARVYSLAFSPKGVDPPLLAVASSHGSVHLFKCDMSDDPNLHQQQMMQQAAPLPSSASGVLGWGGNVVSNAAYGLFSAAMKYSNTDLVDPVRHLAKVELPVKDVPFICRILPPDNAKASESASAAYAERNAPPGSSSFIGGYKAKILVASLDGLLYEYVVEDEGLKGATAASGPMCSLQGEWTLLGSVLP
eukprot:gene12576-15800_t